MLPKWYYKVIGQNDSVVEVTSTPRRTWSLYAGGHEGAKATCDYYEGHRREIAHFVACLESGEPFAIDAEQSLEVDEILADARQQLGLEQ